MGLNRRSRALVFAALAILLAVAVFLVTLRSAPQEASSLLGGAGTAKAIATEASLESAPEITPATFYEEAGRRFRAGDPREARAVLAELTREFPAEAAEAQTVAGLQAWAGERPKEAAEILGEIDNPGGALEDWRLWALADVARKADDAAEARRLYERLAGDYPGSPLRGRALYRAARMSVEDDPVYALELIKAARGRGEVGGNGLSRELASELDEFAWRIGQESGDEFVEREAAKLLLVYAPMRARSLEVASIFRDEDGRIRNWAGVLTPEQVKERSRSWIDARMGPSAVVTLDSLDESHRDLEWHLLKAEALTASGRADRALALLAGVEAATGAEQAALEWRRAMAANTLSKARSGHRNLPKAERRRFAREARRHLRDVVAVAGDPELAADAARLLFADSVEQERYEDALAMLRALRRFDPDDRTGARFLWERGWKEFRARNYSGAVAHWTELEELYPDDKDAHRGRYWKARAFENLGETRRSLRLYGELVGASDTMDFYALRALTRLDGEDIQPAAPVRTRPSWPAQPELRRSLLLSDIGLDVQGRQELGLVEEAGNPRDVVALKGIIAVRRGMTATGVHLLRKAYPGLAGPRQGGIPEPVLRAYYPMEHREAIVLHARKRDLPPSLVAGIIRQESAFDVKATSPVGARGLMQLMPATAKEVAGKLGQKYSRSRLYDPDFSVLLGTTYFRQVLDMFDGNVELALAGYNGGPNRIRRLWREEGAEPQLDLFLENLKIEESKNYVKRILVLSDSYRQLYPEDHRPAAAEGGDA